MLKRCDCSHGWGGTCEIAASTWCLSHGSLCAVCTVMCVDHDGCRVRRVDWTVPVHPASRCAVAVCPNYVAPRDRLSGEPFPLCPGHDELFE